MSAKLCDLLHRGPDKLARDELRDRLHPKHRRHVAVTVELREFLLETLDRLDDAERLLEERGS